MSHVVEGLCHHRPIYFPVSVHSAHYLKDPVCTGAPTHSHLVTLKRKLCPLCVAAFVEPHCFLWKQLSPIVSGFPSGAPDVGLLDQCGRCARANFSGCWFSMGSGCCCSSTTIKPLRSRALLPASSFMRSYFCIIEVTVLKAASHSCFILVLCLSPEVWKVGLCFLNNCQSNGLMVSGGNVHYSISLQVCFLAN